MDDFEEDIAAWGAKPEPASTGDVLRDAVKKEQIIKDILAGQGDLRVLLQKIKSVQVDVDKLGSENATLQMYIDNLTKQLARR